jgi:isopenicillin N synthase-like dioxygenase
MSVPIVDFGKFLNGDESQKKEIASQIDSAFRNVGFVYLKNHTVPQEAVEECFQWARHSSLPNDLY